VNKHFSRFPRLLIELGLGTIIFSGMVWAGNKTLKNFVLPSFFVVRKHRNLALSWPAPLPPKIKKEHTSTIINTAFFISP
jgi:hypothetical protein